MTFLITPTFLMFWIALGTQGGLAASDHTSDTSTPFVLRLAPASSAISTPSLAFDEMLKTTAMAPEPTPKLLGLAGKQTTVVGYMAQMELPSRGGFYVYAYPILCDESANGRGDLPQMSVFVKIPWAQKRAIAFTPGPLQIAGILEFGHNVSETGEVTTLRLLVKNPQDLRRANIPRPISRHKTKKPETRR